jgi:hypothetical protein
LSNQNPTSFRFPAADAGNAMAMTMDRGNAAKSRSGKRNAVIGRYRAEGELTVATLAILRRMRIPIEIHRACSTRRN